MPAKVPGMFALPRERAQFHYECAKSLFKKGHRVSVELERCVHELTMSTSFVPDNVSYQMLLVDVLLACCDTSSALYRLRHVIHLDPGNRKAKKLLFKILMISGKELLKSALRVPQGDEQGLEMFALAEGRFTAAQKLEKEIFDQMDPEIWVMKSISQSSRGHCMEAIDSLDRAIHIRSHMDDDNTLCEVYVLKAKILWQQGLMDVGNKTIGIASKLNPRHPEVIDFADRTYDQADTQYRNAVHAFGNKEYDDALNFSRAALSIVVDDVKLHILVTKIHRMMGNLQEAYTSINHAVTMFQDNAKQAENEKIRAKAKFDKEYGSPPKPSGVGLGSLDPTITMTDDTAAIGGGGLTALVDHSTLPHSFGVPPEIIVQQHLVLNEMALKYAQDGEFEKAIALLTKVLLAETEQGNVFGGWVVDYRYFVNRGDCYRAQHNYSSAIDDYKAGLHLSEGNWQIRTRLGLTYYQHAVNMFNDGDFVGAETFFTKAIEQNYKVPHFFSSRGRARYYLGKYDGAYADYARALELKPDDIDVKRRLEQFATGAQKGLKLTKNTNAGEGESLVKPVFEPLIHTGTGSDARTTLAPGATARALVNIQASRKLPHVPSNKIESSINTRKAATKKAVKDFRKYGHKVDRTELPREIDMHKGLSADLMGSLGALNMKSNTCIGILTSAHARSDRKFRNIFDEKQPTAKSTPWTMFTNAREVARMHIKKPAEKDDANGDVEKVPHTTTAMKALSKRKTEETLRNNPIVGGIFTSWDDKELLALTDFDRGAHP
jgi:tetratricopeptide (TPR) repeat protein